MLPQRHGHKCAVSKRFFVWRRHKLSTCSLVHLNCRPACYWPAQLVRDALWLGDMLYSHASHVKSHQMPPVTLAAPYLTKKNNQQTIWSIGIHWLSQCEKCLISLLSKRTWAMIALKAQCLQQLRHYSHRRIQNQYKKILSF